jgi:hypothetical protein
MSPSHTRILSNLPVPRVDGYAVKLFSDYLPEGMDPSKWRAEKERRDLSEILRLIPQTEKPDILLFASPEYLPIPVDISSFQGLKILLITDWNMCLRFLPDLCPLFDLCYTDWPGYRLLKRAGVANVRHQPLFGHDPDRYKVTGKPRDLDVSFCGNLNSGLHGERNRLLARIAKWGAGKRPPAGAFSPGRSIHLRQAFGDDYVDLLNRSRLVFNYSIRGEANMRLFESMACGAVPLVEESNQEAAILFQEGKHYFRYAPDRLEETLDSLLADPARIEAVSAAAREFVGRHAKSSQIRSLLEDAGRETRGRETGSREAPVRSGSGIAAPSADGIKALVKLRVLGAGYTMAEAVDELQARSTGLPGLGAETLPASLLTLLIREAATPMPAAERILERYLQDTGQPEAVRAFFGMKLDVIRERWEPAIERADACLRALDALASAPGTVRRLYGHFHPPLDLGKGMNADLNRAFGMDLAGGKLPGYLDLLRAHCHAEKARASLAIGAVGESSSQLEDVPPGRFASLDPYEALIADRLRLGDLDGVRATLRFWFSQSPLDTAAWNRIFNVYAAIGDRPAVVRFLREITTLAEAFLSPEQCEVIRGLSAAQAGAA